jgi:hypothetical protein
MNPAQIGILVLGIVVVLYGLWMLIFPDLFLRVTSFKGHMRGLPWRNSMMFRPVSIRLVQILGGLTIVIAIVVAIYYMIQLQG